MLSSIWHETVVVLEGKTGQKLIVLQMSGKFDLWGLFKCMPFISTRQNCNNHHGDFSFSTDHRGFKLQLISFPIFPLLQTNKTISENSFGFRSLTQITHLYFTVVELVSYHEVRYEISIIVNLIFTTKETTTMLTI